MAGNKNVNLFMTPNYLNYLKYEPITTVHVESTFYNTFSTFYYFIIL